MLTAVSKGVPVHVCEGGVVSEEGSVCPAFTAAGAETSPIARGRKSNSGQGADLPVSPGVGTTDRPRLGHCSLLSCLPRKKRDPT